MIDKSSAVLDLQAHFNYPIRYKVVVEARTRAYPKPILIPEPIPEPMPEPMPEPIPESITKPTVELTRKPILESTPNPKSESELT